MELSRIELNGLIERLIESNGHDEEARNAIVDFALRMKGSAKWQFKGLYQKEGGSVSGQTPQHGQVEIKDDKPEMKEFTAGSHQERIGYYKLWRQKDWVYIAHFWKSDIETHSETELAQQWVIAVDKKNKPLWFGERGMKPLFCFHLTKVLTVDFSREIFEERWGPSINKHHKGAIAIAVSISA